MVMYFSFCRGYGEPKAFMVVVQNTPLFTRRDYKEVLHYIRAHVDQVNCKGAFAEVYRAEDGKGAVRVLTLDFSISYRFQLVEQVDSFFGLPVLVAETCINDTRVRSWTVAE